MHNIVGNASSLKLANTKENYELMIKEAINNELDYYEFLDNLLANEVIRRNENSIKNRIRDAKFPYKAYLEDYKLEHLKKENRKTIEIIKDLSFINNKENIIMFGNPGVGKTHLAIGLGLRACQKGLKVLFTSVPNLILQIRESMNLNQIQSFKKKFQKYDLVIVDELGYVSFEKELSEVLFNILSSRNDKGAIIITTNLPFERWTEVFKEPVLTTAIVDRLAHKSHILDLSGDSYRMKETVDWVNKTM